MTCLNQNMFITNMDFDRLTLRITLRTARRNISEVGQSSDAKPILAGLLGRSRDKLQNLDLLKKQGERG
ncbi:hypothetical protein ACFX13_014109 [Malus domestica]